MAITDITAQAQPWPGPNQYIQTTINAGSPGDTYRLLPGYHELQSFVPQNGDTILFMPGAILTGGQNIGTAGWVSSGGQWYKDGIGLSKRTSTGEGLGGYDPFQLEWCVIDNEPMAFADSPSGVNEYTAYYDAAGDRLWVGRDPTTASRVEIARMDWGIRGGPGINNVTIRANDPSTLGVVQNYASYPQSEGAAFGVARTTDPAGTGWLVEHMEVRGCSGAGLVIGSGVTVQHCYIHHMGQIGAGGSQAEYSTFQYNHMHYSPIGGWNPEWEAGNAKFSFTLGCTFRGNLWGTGTHPNLIPIASFWLDLDNEDYDIYDERIEERPTSLGKRGMFLEISYSGDVFHNIIYNAAAGTSGPEAIENGHWANGIILSQTGAIQGTTVRDWVTCEDNIMYDCSGGIKSVNSPREEEQAGGWNTPRYGFESYATDYQRHYRNVTYHRTAEYVGIFENFPGKTGSIADGEAAGPNIIYEDNLYFIGDNTDLHWTDGLAAGAGDTTWAGWNGEGFDTPGGYAITERVHPRGDPDPYNGGCM